MERQFEYKTVLADALEDTRLPSWQRKQHVPRHRESRIAVRKETHKLFKEIARRNKTNLSTAVWLSGYRFWFGLGYSRKDYDSIMVDPTLDELRKNELKELNDFSQSIGLFEGLDSDNSEAKQAEVVSRVRKLPEDQQVKLFQILQKKGLLGG